MTGKIEAMVEVAREWTPVVESRVLEDDLKNGPKFWASWWSTAIHFKTQMMTMITRTW
jgi:hypothetical protein